jgi:glutamate dehydrogenase (NADP+)
MSDVESEINQFMREFKKRNKYEVEFHQAVEGVLKSVMPWYLDQEELREAKVLERMTEPDRSISFRIAWEGDDGQIHVNRGHRVQFNNSLGPYKGGLRFDPDLEIGTLKFLGFEQILKNSLTGLPMGGAKGGADFNPKGKSDREIMRFCKAFMTELYRHLGESVDVPAGDIGVGSREISYLFGQYKRIQNRWAGVITGKECSFGGSPIRKEATGYGCVYFCKHMTDQIEKDISDMSFAISGSGNVALYAAEKAIELGSKVISMSDSSGTIYIENGLSSEQLKFIKDLKENKRGRIYEAAEKYKSSMEYLEGKKPWGLKCDIALPCATQNEMDLSDCKELVNNKVKIVCEGANMPITSEGEDHLAENAVLHAPGKASNAGGVAVSGLEQSQNSMRMMWSKERVDSELQSIMKEIHDKCSEHGKNDRGIDYVKGANLGGFIKVARSLKAYGF